MTNDAHAGRLLCALDTVDLDAAVATAASLRGLVGGIKLGLEFFTAHGPAGVTAVAACGLPIFLDLKFFERRHHVLGEKLVRKILEFERDSRQKLEIYVYSPVLMEKGDARPQEQRKQC